MNKHYTHLPDPDLDLAPRPRPRTIRSVLDGADLTTMSDGEFDVRYLAQYPNRSQLDDCCSMAVKELGDQPFVGRQSCARVMGRAMELLRETYGLDAPRGWVLVLRRLRAEQGDAGRQMEEERRTSRLAAKSAAESQFEREYEASRLKDLELLRYRPDEILTDAFSPIHRLPSGTTFAEFVEGRHDLKQQFIDLAERVGVPGGWWDALSFLEFIADGLEEVPEPFREAVNELRSHYSRNTLPPAGEIQHRIDELRLERRGIRTSRGLGDTATISKAAKGHNPR